MKHSITVQFTTDSPLTEQEMNNLVSMIALQVQEPQDLEGNDEAWTAKGIEFHYQDLNPGKFFTADREVKR
jgi:hypothetical protein